VIRVNKIGKQYFIGANRGSREGGWSYRTIRDVITNVMQSPVRRIARLWQGNAYGAADMDESIWALKDISFEIKPGEVIGLIGRNGAGKSTLLKIFSRITEPTEGRAEIHGRVGSLLEVGTGFHPELTGRENIYLNGSILGMGRKEISRKFDEIVKFAEVEKFIDTPVKFYSSGMYVRLAFAVAAHLEPEILLVDEVLAVGDIAFQKKCLGKMGEVTEHGRTVLFVSHQMNSIRKLCKSCIWLDKGRVRMMGPTAEVVGAYESAQMDIYEEGDSRGRSDNMPVRFLNWEIVAPTEETPHILNTLGNVTFKFVVEINQPIDDGMHGIALFDDESKVMWATNLHKIKLDEGIHDLFYSFDGLPLHPGTYSWQVSLWDKGKMLDLWNGVPRLIVGTEPLTNTADKWSGVLNVPCDFSINRSKIEIKHN